MKRNDWETNRDVAKKFKSGLFWCWGCDANHVSDGEKCDVCGHIDDGQRRFKKQYTYED